MASLGPNEFNTNTYCSITDLGYKSPRHAHGHSPSLSYLCNGVYDMLLISIRCVISYTIALFSLDGLVQGRQGPKALSLDFRLLF